MRIYVFRSDAGSGLQAFAGDRPGAKLPDRFGPWHMVGVIGPNQDPPHNLPRDEIEKAINTQGFQLWRITPKPDNA